jgi:hypothetical protein
MSSFKIGQSQAELPQQMIALSVRLDSNWEPIAPMIRMRASAGSSVPIRGAPLALEALKHLIYGDFAPAFTGVNAPPTSQ